MNSSEYENTILEYEMAYEPISPSLARLAHAVIGITGEAGEVAEIVKKHVYYGKELNKNEVIKEVGDVLFYCAVMLNAIDSNMSEAMNTNAFKLSLRYKNGYSSDAALKKSDKGVL